MVVRRALARLLVLPSCLHGQSAPDAMQGAAPTCSLDLTGDGALDAVVLLEVGERHRLVALVARGDGYAAHVLREYGRAAALLACRLGERLTSTAAGRGAGVPTVHTTPGAYVALTFPETSEVAYYWRDGAFAEVWLAD